MQRVLVLIKGLGLGGAEQLLVNAAPYLDRSRFRYEVAYLRPDKDALVDQLEAHGLPVHCLGPVRGIAWLGRLTDLVRRHRIDLVHAHSPLAVIGARLVLPRRMPIVYTEHNVWGSYRLPTYWANLLTYWRNDHVFTVSDEVRSSIRQPRRLPFLPATPVETLHHGLDLAASARWVDGDGIRRELGIPEGAPVVGTVGSFKAQKDHRTLIRAAAIARRRLPELRLVLVGDGPLRQELRREASASGIDGAVLFTGYRDDAPRVMRAFDVFVLSSLHEGLSIALLEAMSLGRPVVVTRVGGLPEVVRDNRDGLVVSPGDPARLAEALTHLLSDPRTRAHMGKSARERAGEFDIRKAVARIEQVYGRLLEGGTRRWPVATGHAS